MREPDEILNPSDEVLCTGNIVKNGETEVLFYTGLTEGRDLVEQNASTLRSVYGKSFKIYECEARARGVSSFHFRLTVSQ